MQIVIISGLSGAGKSIALETFEDEGFFCVDNLPLSFVLSFVEKFAEEDDQRNLAIVVDARGFPADLARTDEVFRALRHLPQKTDFVFLDATNEAILQRYRDTRRRHPFYKTHRSLLDTIEYERSLLQPLLEYTDLHIDTSSLSVHDLRAVLKKHLLAEHERRQLFIQIESFGFKNGVPLNSDFVFDARCLTNPHWEPSLRPQTGRDSAVIDYLNDRDDVQAYLKDLEQFFDAWLPKFEQGTRAYLTIAIGCTGGQHRSVYLVEQLARNVAKRYPLIVKHRELHITHSCQTQLEEQ
ncbi:RNase adapter RapZ [Wohlfahrtiimonas chitiniclastica]|uniref:RNase adapter RapZ n=1 Tax=Wohlfahrtiimonas chitiniclastica TaxID=400946 RepID=A0AB35BZP4_9GAMM|nr:RNase adapter RapZ [Wohlfahrtiimonas chitiniclastica]MBS7824926.1 RNase adapter RapZ [Wohlfahrtiimonas chitiniclastica]MBS7838564.1 RNase adapter RapZ [Wohlfahrtiimonas chitiniclastica]MBS7840535.1 RNase adapter RapZ [Wohlfahrtiimonas chitiniclastica]OYQ75856.1 RNase adaptor protein RapZ [Wohlfahrtiimonas chitiniclastica]